MKESLLRATLQVGHGGATDAIVAELREQVKRRKVVKAKRLRSADVAGAEKEFWSALAQKAGVRLLEVRGRTAVLADPAYRTLEERRRGRKRPAAPRNA